MCEQGREKAMTKAKRYKGCGRGLYAIGQYECNDIGLIGGFRWN
jgi:hypothetical protein